MTKIKCQQIEDSKKGVRIRIVKAPLVNSQELRTVLLRRAKALVI